MLESGKSVVSENSPSSRMRMAKRFCARDAIEDCFELECTTSNSPQECTFCSTSPGTSPHKLPKSIRIAKRFCTMDAFEGCSKSEASAATSPGRTLRSSTPAHSPHTSSTPMRMAKRLCAMDALGGDFATEAAQCTCLSACRWNWALSGSECWCSAGTSCRGAALNADSSEFCLESVGVTVEAAHEWLCSFLRGKLPESDNFRLSRVSTAETMAKTVLEMQLNQA